MVTNLYSSASRTSGRLRTRLTALAAALLLAPAAWAQAPANDNCTGAIALTPGATCTVVTGTNENATASTAPAPSCGGTTTTGSNDVWYSVVVPAGGAVTVTTSSITGSPFVDSVIELYTGSCTSLTSVFCNDDATGLFSSATASGLTAGSTVYARVMNYGTTPTGQFGVCATIPAAVPANDNPAGAVALTLGATCTPVNGTNAAATTTTANGYANPGAAPYSCGIAVTPKDVWYRFTTAASGAGSTSVSIQVTGNPAGYLRAFSAASAAGPFTEIGCASGGANNVVSTPLNLSGLTPSTTYYVSVAGYGSADTQGAFTICASSTAAAVCAAPTAVSVGSITTTSASLVFTPGSGNTSYTVTYFPTATPTAVTTVTPTPTASPVALTGLTAGTAYTVTLQAICAGGGTTGLITRTFTSSALAPANNECATAVTLTPSAAGGACTATNGTVAGATQSSAPILCNGFTASAAQDVWYSFVATATSHTVTVTGNFDGVLEVLSGACGALTNVGCADATGNNETLNLTALTVGTTYRMRYYPYSSNPTNGTFTICVTTPVPLAANDAAVQTVYTVGKAPVSAPQIVQAVVRNAGSAALPAFPLTLNVTGANTFTDAKIVPALAVGASATITFAAYTPAAIGTNTVTVTAPNDGQASNNTLVYTQAVTANNLSYIDDSQPLNATGIGVSSTTPNGILVSKYTINSQATIGEIRLNFPALATTTSTYQAVVVSALAAGTPGTVLFTSPTLNRPTAAGVVTVPVTGAVTVNGTFYVGIKEIAGNVQVGYQVESPLRPATFYFQGGGTTTWTDVSTVGTPPFTTRLAIEVGFSARTLSTNSAALSKAISMFPNPSNGQVTLDIQGAQAKGSMQVEIINMLGQVVHTSAVRDNAQNKLDLSSLSNGMYTVRIKSGSEYTIRQLALTK
ncbi:T9SS type A sorting domain-containing protein [Microvirga sp. STR05]|uniref:T9SS type A sorting domain-containing protein n=1 Tax=Hymenobacter duratus TaxID=2771356 RepID=A0ABR8JE46_9BACT|nr:T9SS type A sorting domain-containing protein [Hymenobacter duratus]MBD2713981.1 T9SS type A sorting domain-containing protein [Hymenobacter duratus]MBR7948883.1 T9SS type A sorting domain-containing protein [Microvirga sp. STR05]